MKKADKDKMTLNKLVEWVERIDKRVMFLHSAVTGHAFMHDDVRKELNRLKLLEAHLASQSSAPAIGKARAKKGVPNEL